MTRPRINKLKVLNNSNGTAAVAYTEKDTDKVVVITECSSNAEAFKLMIFIDSLLAPEPKPKPEDENLPNQLPLFT